MEKYTHIKKYINCYLFENIEKVSSDFRSLLKGYRICEITELKNKEIDILLNFESQLLDFFNGILQNEPLRHTEQLMQLWQNSAIHSECNLHPVLPEDIIAYYSILKETLLQNIIPYASPVIDTENLSNEIHDLELEIQRLITDTFIKLNAKSDVSGIVD